MEPQYILTQQEYNDLLTVQTQPDQLLRDTNKQLKAKLDQAEAKLKQGSFDQVKLDSPLFVQNNKLCFRSATDFIVFYNNLSNFSLTETDNTAMHNLLHIATLFNYEPQFADQSKLKAYRVSLQKKGICKPTKVAGFIKLTKD